MERTTQLISKREPDRSPVGEVHTEGDESMKLYGQQQQQKSCDPHNTTQRVSSNERTHVEQVLGKDNRFVD